MSQFAAAAGVEENIGYLILAISTPVVGNLHDKEYLSVILKICSQDGRDSLLLDNAVNDWMSSDKNDFDEPDEAGMVFTKALHAGSWKVCSYSAADTLGKLFGPQGTLSLLDDLLPSKDFSIPFTIAPGRATYIGDFKAVGTTDKSLLGLTVVAGPRWVVTDQSKRDIAIAQKRYPGLQSVDVAVPDVDKLNDPRFAGHDSAPACAWRWVGLHGQVCDDKTTGTPTTPASRQ
jgi:hypothetical protein